MGAEDHEPRRAVVDRVVEGVAVLLVGDAQEEHRLDAADLPDDVGEGAWLSVTRDGDRLRILGVDEAGAETKRAALSERMARIRRRRAGGRFDR